MLSDLTDRTITRIVVEDDEWKTTAVDRGMPAAAADFTLGRYHAARRGESAVTDPTLQALLGRRPASVRTALESLVATKTPGPPPT